MNPIRRNAIPCVSEQGIISIEQGIKSSDQRVYQASSGYSALGLGAGESSRKKPGTDKFSLAFVDLLW